ncbi:MAG TPA: ABC transporter substrate-binding protein [Chloroflexota bacterium]|nr:ABC transporter substrate-binding protein [Chloroflexota bacterium]
MRLAIPDLISNSYFPVIVAAELGFFRDEGLDIDHVELFFPVPKAMQALKEGEFDFVAGAAHATLQAFSDWRGARLLAALAQHMYWFLVLRADLGAKRGELGKLKGLRIGAAPGPDLGLLRLLREIGLEPGRDVQVGPVPGASAESVSFGVTAAQALADGQLDGFWANGMGAEVAVRRGIGTIVLDVRRGDGPEPARHYTFPALVTREDLVQRHPETAAAAVRALIRAQECLREDPSRATAIAQPLFPPMEASLIAGLIRRDVPYYDPAISPENFAALTQFAIEMGILSQPVPYDEVVHPLPPPREG